MNIRPVLVVIAFAAVLPAGHSALHAQDRARSVWDGVYTEAQAKRGLPLYNQHCLDCHGDDLEGDAETPALKGGTFLTNWDGQKLGDLFTRIHRDMPLNFEAGKLSSAVVADLLAYILNINQFPPGSVELPHAVEVLNEIRFQAQRPEHTR
ncbi:MAG TPA: cytochrome c [Bryobacteraceae bacterium]|nr:cytochrome c [Bryobacteraceae bacterium]